MFFYYNFRCKWKDATYLGKAKNKAQVCKGELH
jgi:hypothetical protein